MSWQTLRPVPLAAARTELHGGAVLLASVADTFLERRDDDSQSNLGLSEGPRGFTTRDLGGAALALDGIAQTLRWRAGDEARSFPLAGRTMREGLDWVAECARESLGREVEIAVRHYDDMPPIDALSGGVFRDVDRVALAVFFDWYENAYALFDAYRTRAPELSELRIWPHHFDLGALLPVDPPRATIGLGLSPGDVHDPDPYLYCSPYPQPAAPAEGGEALPELDAGAWLRGSFTTAWLRAEVLEAAQDQPGMAERYLRGAVAACRQIVG